MRFSWLVFCALLLTGCASSGKVTQSPGDSAPDDTWSEIDGDASEEEDSLADTDLAPDNAETTAPDLLELDDADSPADIYEVGPDFVDEQEALSELDAETVEDLSAEPQYETTLITSTDGAPWEANRLIEVDHPALSGEKFVEKTSHNDPAIAALFDGDPTPAPGRFVLHVSSACLDGSATKAPVLLVHGAGSNAMQTWVEPTLLGDGLAQGLMIEGLCVYAISFAHPFGDVLNQAVAIAAALELVRLETAAPEVTVVAHSKGGIATAAYASGMGADAGLSYADDIGTMVMLGVPLGGTDFSFRHPGFNYPVELLQLTMPSSWDKILEWGVWKDIYDDSIYGGAFNGILQILTAWDEVYPLPVVEQDWYTTYYGGQGFVSHSLGIATAVDMGGNFMAQLHQHQVPGDVAVFLGSGGLQLMNGVPWETTGPSDGLVFTASATDDSLFSGPVTAEHFPLLNHWDLVSSSTVADWILSAIF